MNEAEIIQGDCFDEMAKLRANSYGAGVTDPPYGIRFMGKAWDGADIQRRHISRRQRERSAFFLRGQGITG